ncbi:hypothetical protein [Kaistella jeonii]|nr:hypothetical protein [Kaistella jeonii]SFC42481.1 hypothetical protein SAMN05421876_1213 [Kaistella jeonii]VEI96798.1 Uncharacterised protein [Kaistella jeonii]
MRTMLIFLIFYFLFSCTTKSGGNTIKQDTQKPISDTILAPLNTKLSDSCKIISQKYFYKYGFYISKFYDVDQNISKKDISILLLKPFYTKQDYLLCFPEKADYNLLVIRDLNTKKVEIYNNLLFSDDRDVYQEIKPTKNGFKISAEQGSSSKFYSDIFISNSKVDSLKIESWGFAQYKKTYKFKKMTLNSFNVSLIDSLQTANSK